MDGPPQGHQVLLLDGGRELVVYIVLSLKLRLEALGLVDGAQLAQILVAVLLQFIIPCCNVLLKPLLEFPEVLLFLQVVERGRISTFPPVPVTRLRIDVEGPSNHPHLLVLREHNNLFLSLSIRNAIGNGARFVVCDGVHDLDLLEPAVNPFVCALEDAVGLLDRVPSRGIPRIRPLIELLELVPDVPVAIKAAPVRDPRNDLALQRKFIGALLAAGTSAHGIVVLRPVLVVLVDRNPDQLPDGLVILENDFDQLLGFLVEHSPHRPPLPVPFSLQRVLNFFLLRLDGADDHVLTAYPLLLLLDDFLLPLLLFLLFLLPLLLV
mmetsp:Transcript_17326/g.35193  ORF Transcript_17326/g.35193 Transcript_17326/m.35193 type:complete len:323 (-) Transcript_17326:1102-2070(-)